MDDGCADTPAQKEANYACAVAKDSCTKDAGADPVWNYMDYSYACSVRLRTRANSSLVW